MNATLSVTPAPRSGWHVTLDCRHGTTHAAVLNPSTAGLEREDAIRVALMKHYDSARCRCVRRLWKRHFGARLGELILARGRAPS